MENIKIIKCIYVSPNPRNCRYHQMGKNFGHFVKYANWHTHFVISIIYLIVACPIHETDNLTQGKCDFIHIERNNQHLQNLLLCIVTLEQELREKEILKLKIKM